MRNSTTSKSGLFLMEMILVVLLFSLSAAICLQMFAYASLTAERAENLSNATLCARSAAACYQSTDGDLDEIARILSGNVSDNSVLVSYGSNWSSEPSPATYFLQLIPEGAVAHISLYELGVSEPIYTLDTRIAGGDGR